MCSTDLAIKNTHFWPSLVRWSTYFFLSSSPSLPPTLLPFLGDGGGIANYLGWTLPQKLPPGNTAAHLTFVQSQSIEWKWVCSFSSCVVAEKLNVHWEGFHLTTPLLCFPILPALHSQVRTQSGRLSAMSWRNSKHPLPNYMYIHAVMFLLAGFGLHLDTHLPCKYGLKPPE